MCNSIENWYTRKLNQRLNRLRESRRSTQEYNRHAVRIIFAKLTLRGEPADAFSFVSDGAWASEKERLEYEPYVLDGILDLLMAGPSAPILGVRMVLESTLTHPIHSSGASFYLAARAATQEITGVLEKYPHNYELDAATRSK